MNRAFTTREKILVLILAILALGCFYYLVVYSPAADAISSGDTRLAAAQDELVVEQSKNKRLQTMEAAIEDAKRTGVYDKVVPEYDNTKAEMTELDSILSTAETYSISFGEPVLEGNIVRRPVSITFKAPDYDSAEAVVKRLINGKYSCLVTDISIKTSGSSSGGVSAGVEAVMFERATAVAQSTLSSSNTSNTSKSSASTLTSDVANNLTKNSSSK